MKRARSRDAGFTLIETLVALAILALAAVSLLGATEAHIVRINGLETRASAQWVAENVLAELTLGLAPSEAESVMNGITFTTEVAATPTKDPDLEKLEIVVRDAADGREYANLVGFRDTFMTKGSDN